MGVAPVKQGPPALPAGSGQPPILPREMWAQGHCIPRVAPEYGSVELAFVHHTENPNGYLPAEVPGMLRAIFTFHRDGRGWNDIGYNFVIDRFGRIFEARAGGIDEPVIGAQAGGYNYRSTGIGILGEYGAQRISPAARSALARLLAWKLSLHGAPVVGRVAVRVNPTGAIYSRFPAGTWVSLPRIAGHRDGDSTSCPGDALYGELPALRMGAEKLAGRPVRATLLIQAQSRGAATAVLEGAMAFLDGTPVSGAPVEVQVRHVSHRGQVVKERTIAQATSGPDGRWSLPVSISPEGAPVSLRALCPGAGGIPAAVSDPLRVPGMPVFSPPPAPAPGPTSEAAVPPAP